MPIDQKVKKTQEWVNETYRTVTGYVERPEDGYTGWLTMYALTRALQIELGITALSNNFGPTTMSKLEAYGPIDSDESNTNLIKINQSAFFCKGYDAWDIDGVWGSRPNTSTATAVENPLVEVLLDDELQPPYAHQY